MDRSNRTTRLIAGIAISTAVLLFALPAIAGSSPAESGDPPSMTQHARGPFTVKMMPQGDGNTSDGISTGRMSLDKVFSGDLDAIGKGEMLAARTAIDNSAGYVAIERVTGTLAGRKGSFVLQHSGTMTRGEQQLVISVVPDSGAGELTGIAGVMTIDIGADGAHRYDLTYALPAVD